MEYVISAIIAVTMLSVFLFIALKGAVKRIDNNAKKYFLEKIQTYNYLIDEKKAEVDSWNEKVEALKNQCKEYEEAEEKLKRAESLYKKMQEDRAVKTKVEIIQTPQYKDKTFFKDYKQLKQKFDVNGEKILKAFMEEHTGKENEKLYKAYSKILSKFSSDFIYSVVTSDSKERYHKVDKILTKTEKELIDFETYANTKFNILDLVNTIKEKVASYDPTIYVYTSKVGVNYDYLDKRICTKTYENMSEGIIIEYQNQLYDYSI